MRRIDYEKTNGTYKVRYENGEIVQGTINIDENSIKGNAPLAKAVINNEIGQTVLVNISDSLNIMIKILEKNLNIVYEQSYRTTCYKKDGYKNVKDEVQFNKFIYYLYYYKPYECYVENTTSNLIIRGLKENGYEEEFKRLYYILKKYFFNKFDIYGKEYVLCCVPSHIESQTNNTNIAQLLSIIAKEKNCIDGTNCLIRTKEIPEQKKAGKRSEKVHSDSIEVRNKHLIEGKNVILIDDIVTSGSSIRACRRILYDNGAKNVYCFAFGKTKGALWKN